jgi:hypothetical protein
VNGINRSGHIIAKRFGLGRDAVFRVGRQRPRMTKGCWTRRSRRLTSVVRLDPVRAEEGNELGHPMAQGRQRGIQRRFLFALKRGVSSNRRNQHETVKRVNNTSQENGKSSS